MNRCQNRGGQNDIIKTIDTRSEPREQDQDNNLPDYAQIPLDLSCLRPGLRLVGDQVADKSETRSPTFFVENLSPTCLRPGPRLFY